MKHLPGHLDMSPNLMIITAIENSLSYFWGDFAQNPQS